MRILITGATGYIGQRLIPVLLAEGHSLYCCVRNKERFLVEHNHELIHVIEIDFLKPNENQIFPEDIDVAFFLIHSMSSKGEFAPMEAESARNFIQQISPAKCQQVIYLSGIVNDAELSNHLSSRYEVERILRTGPVPVTVLRAGIIVGSGSASFEIIRDIVERLPILLAPKWVNSLCQPIAIRNVLQFLKCAMMRPETFDKDNDIGGPDILSYREMLMQYAEVRNLNRRIYNVFFITPRFSAYMLYFMTSTSYRLVSNLVDSMKVNVVCRKNNLAQELGIELLTYKQALQNAFRRIDQNMVISSWKDSFSSFDTKPELMEFVNVPRFGCYRDEKQSEILGSIEKVRERIWSIGGETGWYYGNFLWKFGGFLDRTFLGGIGSVRGRTHPNKLKAGDSLDSWRVFVADKNNNRLLLFAEIKMPGEGWLEFKIINKDGKDFLHQTATFRPHGVPGRLYWTVLFPFRYLILNGMINQLVKE